jgi:hypothetical protein
MTIIEHLNKVLLKHLGTNCFGPVLSCGVETHNYWARLLLDADLNDTLFFGKSVDAEKLEVAQRSVRNLTQQLVSLSYATKHFTPMAFSSWRIRNMLERKSRNPFTEAIDALVLLESWLTETRKSDTFKQKATPKRNWRAASVAHCCRVIWGHFHWEKAGNPRVVLNALAFPADWTDAQRLAEINRAEEFDLFIEDFAPRSEKLDCPGPFGRFLEDVLAVLGIEGREGKPFSAHSALRSLAHAREQMLAKHPVAADAK